MVDKIINVKKNSTNTKMKHLKHIWFVTWSPGMTDDDNQSFSSISYSLNWKQIVKCSLTEGFVSNFLHKL